MRNMSSLPRTAALLLCVLVCATGTPAFAASGDVFFSEYVEGSGTTNKAVEIYNNSGARIDLGAGAYKVRKYSNGGSTAGSTFNLTGTLEPGAVYVLTNSLTPTSPCVISPAPNQTSGSLDFNGDDALELVRGDNSEVLDVFGQVGLDPGTAWGSDSTSTADHTLRRKSSVTAGDTTGSDAFSPDAQWDGYAKDTCDGLGSHSVDAAGTTRFSIDDVSLAEGNTGTTAFTFTVTKTGSDAGTVDFATLAGSATEVSDYEFASGQLTFGTGTTGTAASQTVSVNVVGDSVDEGVETFSVELSGTVTFGKASGVATILNDDATCTVTHSIMQIQGSAHLSTLSGTSGIVTSGVITQRDSNGFFIQNPIGDDNSATSDAIFVYTGSSPGPEASLVAGDEVCVSGTVTEFRPGGASATGLTITEFTSATITEIPGLFANPTVTPTLLGAGGRAFPSMVIDNDTSDGGSGQGNIETPAQTTYDPDQDGIDFYESLEGMLVQINAPVAVSPDPGNYGEIWMLADGLSSHIGSGRNLRGGITLNENDSNPERFMVSQSFSGATVPSDGSVGDSYTQNSQASLLAIADYLYISGLKSGYYYFAPVAALTRVAGTNTPETTPIVNGPDTLTIADYNVENLASTNEQSKFDGLADQIVNKLGAPDIVALMEVQDDNGATNDGIVDATQTLTKLRDAIAAITGAPSYNFFDIAPVDDADGGQPGGNIRLAYLYNPQRVSFVGGTAGDATTSTAAELTDDGKLALTLNPGRVDAANSDFADSRKPLAAMFEFNGQRLLVVSLHLSSKGGSDPAWGFAQPPKNGSVDKRAGQAAAVNKFVDSALALDPEARIVVLGDVNEFSFNAPTKILLGEQATTDNPIAVVLTDLADAQLPLDERYTYVFEGQSQTLDHLMVSDSLLAGAEIDIVHVNAEFDDQKSDHDPSVAALQIAADEPPPPPSAPTPFTFAERSGVSANTWVTSETVTLEGYSGPLSISVSDGGQFRIGSGNWTSTTSLISAGQTLHLRHLSSADAGGAIETTVSVGSYSTAFRTISADRTPDAFSFGTQTGVAPGAKIESTSVTLSGFNASITLQAGNGLEYSVNGGAYTTANGTLAPGQTLRVRHTASSKNLAYTKTSLKAGGVTGYFTTRTQ